MSDRPEKINLSDVHSRQVDTDLLNELRELFVKAEEQKERYDFTWNGKAKSYFEAAAPTTKTLRAQPEESVNFEKSENLFITGDNLEALKLLQESYLGKIDMIYIDPPYNTGKDFVYQDNFKKTQKENDLLEGNIDADGNRLVKNEKASGRYHSDWLTMMYPRLKLARNLLSDNGVIFVSIDDNEQANLKLLMDEVWGSGNFIESYIWESTFRPDNSSPITRKNAEYVLLYGKNKSKIDYLVGSIEKSDGLPSLTKNSMKSITLNFPANTVKTYLEDGEYESGIKKSDYRLENNVIVKNGLIINSFSLTGRMIWGQEYLNDQLSLGTNIIIKNESFVPYSQKEDTTSAPNKIIPKTIVGDVLEGRSEVTSLFDGKQVFSYPKPTSLIKYFSYLIHNKNAVVMDFFAGSGTTADSIMKLNSEDGGSRKFIIATLDEDLDDLFIKSDNKAKISLRNAIDFLESRRLPHTLDYISRERIRRAAEKIGDISGFRSLKVGSTGLKEDVFKTAGELDQVDLLQDIDNHSDNRSDYDLLYDVLVDGALEYNRPITIDMMNNEKIIKYDYLGELSGVVCYFGGNLTDELTRQIAILKPLLAVFKESTFDKSAQKVNVMEQFRIISPDTKVKVI